VEAPTEDGSCANLLLTAKSVGHTKVSIGYEHLLLELQATITVAAYRPLKAKLDFVAVLCIRTENDIILLEKN